MATFVVTGINRTRSKCYRPSYTSDLAPIYEDKIQPSNRDALHREYVSTVFQPDSLDRSEANLSNSNNTVHDYETRESYMMRPLRQYRPNPQPSQTSVSMLNGIMANRFQAKRKDVSKQSSSPSDNQYINKQPIDNNNVSDGHSNCDVELTRKTSLYQEYPVHGRGNAITPHIETIEPVQKDSKWYKLQPGPSMPRRLLCPAEGKFKRRCFAFCFVLLLAIIGTFVLVSVEGWTYKATGKGFSGKEPMIFKTAVWSEYDNFTHLPNDGDYGGVLPNDEDYGDV